jgi:predicted metal-dependent phosphoesterase TrpH
MLKLDLHVHSHYSEDATGSPKEIMKVLIKKNIMGAAITDHNSIKGSLQALKDKP